MIAIILIGDITLQRGENSMELSASPIVIKKEKALAEPNRYFIVDGREIKSISDVPHQLRNDLGKQLTGGEVKPIVPTTGIQNDFCRIISSQPMPNPVTSKLSYPWYAFKDINNTVDYGEQFISMQEPFYIGLVLMPGIPELTLQLTTLVPLIKAPASEVNPLADVVNLTPVPKTYQLFGTHTAPHEDPDKDNYVWEAISDKTTVDADMWSLDGPTELQLLKEGIDRNLLTYRGFKFEIYDWHTEHCEPANMYPGLARIGMTFDPVSLKLLTKLPLRLPDYSDNFKLKKDEVVAFDISALSNKPIELDSNKPVVGSPQVVGMTDEQKAEYHQFIKDQVNVQLESASKKLANSANATIKRIDGLQVEAIKNLDEPLSAAELRIKKMLDDVAEATTRLNEKQDSLKDVPATDNTALRMLIGNVLQEILSESMTEQVTNILTGMLKYKGKKGTTPASPLMKILDALKGGIAALETRHTELKQSVDGLISNSNLVVIDDMPGLSYILRDTSGKIDSCYNVVNDKPNQSREITFTLPETAEDGETKTITNLRTDGGKIQIASGNKTMTVIYAGQVYRALPKFGLTKYGERIQLTYWNGIWHGRAEDGATSDTIV